MVLPKELTDKIKAKARLATKVFGYGHQQETEEFVWYLLKHINLLEIEIERLKHEQEQPKFE